MPELVSDLEGTLSRMYGQMGVRWPNPWWPTGNSGYDDCAACVSWALWGLNGNQPYQTIVSGIIERSGLPFIAGNQGIRRGDLIGFRWSTDVNYDHMEVALNSPDGAGNFQTIGTNAGPGDNMAVRTRNIGYVHNYARPAYAGVAPKQRGDDMPTLWHRRDGAVTTFALFDGEHWEEFTDGNRANREAGLYMGWNGFGSIDITGNSGLLASWDYRSNKRPDLKVPFGVKPTTGGTAPALPLDLATKGDVAALQAVLTKGITSIKTAITGSKNAILKAIKDKK